FTDGVHTIQDLRVGMQLPGIVTNITNFGAFVDIGVHQDGLVHLSQLANRFVKDPNEVLKVQQKVMVTVTEVDVARNRIGLTMRTAESKEPRSARSKKHSGQKKAGNRSGSKGGKSHARAADRPERKGEDMASKLAALQSKFGGKL